MSNGEADAPGAPARRAGRDGTEAELAVAKGRSVVLAASLTESRTREAGLRDEVAALRAENARLAADLDGARAGAELLRSGTIGRAAELLKIVLGRVPVPARAALRRGAMGAWWVATPHLARRRLALRRATPDRDGEPASLARLEAPVPEAPAGAPAGHRRTIAFHPFPAARQNPAETVDRNGTYALVAPPGHYAYVPPRRPLHEPRQEDGSATRFSIVVPVYNTAPDLLDRMVASVLAQWHAGWELILVDDASPDPRTRDALARLADPRIRVERLGQNGGISAATNAALGLATGDFVVFLDHDDELTPDCLHELALCIARKEPDFIYSDEDKIDPDGGFTQPFFKPDWSPDTMMSTMYTCHVMCVRRTTVAVVGGLRSEFDGSQDYDFVLRLVEHTNRIAHIPKVLYHWRIIPASVSADMNAKPYAIEASRRAREAALERRGLSGTVEPVPQVPVYFRVNYAPQGSPTVSIIIPTKNNAAVLDRCVQSILERTRFPDFEIVVMDNGSTEPEAVAVLRKLERQPRIRVHPHRRPFNYSEINNAGVAQARGELLLFLNDDTEVLSVDWLERMGGYAQLPHVGAVGAKLLYPGTRRVQHNGVLNLDQGPSHAFHNEDADTPGFFMRNLLEWNWAAVTGACLMVERRKFLAAGGFDESFPLAYNDVKLCFDLRDAGLYQVTCPAVELIHHESVSRGLDAHSAEKIARLRLEWTRLYEACPHHFMRDPFHNPNLSATSVYFELPAA